MSKMMLIDAAHTEETRLVVVNNEVIEEFEHQNTYKKSIKGNIYLAKITKITPSLQAAFVDYGGDKHGFLPFAEIHPSYYNIPNSDKQALFGALLEKEDKPEGALDENKPFEQFDINEEDAEEVAKPQVNETAEFDEEAEIDDEANEEFEKDKLDDELADEIRPEFHKNYKIQDVIKKDQVILVQVIKEERGNKGASLTSYISLAGRYCVLMPNSFKSGGISKKIFDNEERRRLKNIYDEFKQKLGAPASIILRTAGSYKTKTEIKRDFNYLVRSWNNIRDHTLASKAPTFIHEEGDVIKKSLRDIYNSDITQVIVEGEKGFKEAKQFIEMVLPKHAERVKLHKGKLHLFSKYNVEHQLSALYNPVTPLRSGGYIVINHTEALVAIDVNSGRSTSERSVEHTAYRTNIEAAHEIARQIRLRDLSGLIVIDFIDMGDRKHRRQVERQFKEAIRHDRAKIQVGNISVFGLLEMSRQRIRNSFVETNTKICPHCEGKGRVRPVEATAISMLRAIETESMISNTIEIKVSGCDELVFYIINNKRLEISEIERIAKVKISFSIDNEAGLDGFFIERVSKKSGDSSAKSASKAALSAIDSQGYQDLEEDIEETNEEEIKLSAPSRKKRWKKEKSPEPQKRSRSGEAKKPTSEAIEIAPESPVENVEVTETIDETRKKRKRRRNKKPTRKLETGNTEMQTSIENDDSDSDNFEQDMANKRKQNQSFLKEIWKKIVE